MAILFTVEGLVVPVTPNNGTDFQLEELSELVGGYIEEVPLRKTGGSLVMNEEGKLMDLPINLLATQLWEKNYGRTDIIVGNALFCLNGEIR
jgi:hypothetical protein